MVTTRSMTGTSKKTDSKISVNQKAAKKPSKREKSKVDGKISVNQKAAKRPSKRAESKVDGITGMAGITGKYGNTYTRPWTIDMDAFTIFMKEDYLEKHYENRPPPPNGITPFEVDCGGQLKWRGMTTKDKAPFLKLARKMKAEGRSFVAF